MVADKLFEAFANDPFFQLSESTDWRACIGQQGDEESYVDGYIETAVLLAETLIDKKLYASRDTLAMPILYNTRHAIELSLKYTIERLHETGVVRESHAKNHDIMSHWKKLEATELGDEKLRTYVTELQPFVASLSCIDVDGQELRYAENQNGQQSLRERALVDIYVIRESLRALQSVLKELKNRVHGLLDERATGTFTKCCSRTDLMEIATMLPMRCEWQTDKFDTAKGLIQERYHLSGTQFSNAIKVIEENRQMRRSIGLNTDLLHLTDEHTLFAVKNWARLHSSPTEGRGRIVNAASISLDDMVEHSRLESEIVRKVIDTLSWPEIVDLHWIYYLSRDHMYCEYYEKKVGRDSKNNPSKEQLSEKVAHILNKTNFQKELANGVSILGRPYLSDQILKIQRSSN